MLLSNVKCILDVQSNMATLCDAISDKLHKTIKIKSGPSLTLRLVNKAINLELLNYFLICILYGLKWI